MARGLLPGEYGIQAALFAEDSRGRRRILERGYATVRVEGGDVDGIAVTTVPPGSIAGRILRDPRANGQLPSSVRVRLIPSYDRMQFAERLLEAVTDRQGAFRIEEAFGPVAAQVMADVPNYTNLQPVVQLEDQVL